MKLFSIIGVSLSGKTTVAETLIRGLSACGHSACSIKEIHFEQFTLDVPGSNTARHRAAGSRLVAARGYQETDLLYTGRLPLTDILLHYDCDYVAMEGVSDLLAGRPLPTVICAHSEAEVERLLHAGVYAISGRIAAARSSVCGLPAYSPLDAAAAAELLQLTLRQAMEYAPDLPYEIMDAAGESVALSARQRILLAAALEGNAIAHIRRKERER